MNDRRLIPRKWLWPVILIPVVVIVVWPWLCWFSPATTVFLVRHADKPSPTVDDLHVPLGTDRADELVHVLGSAGIAAIYHSNTVRSQKTAQPLAAALQIAPTVYPVLDIAQLVAEIRADHSGDRVFVVGHGNTVPEIIDELGGGSPADIPESVYDNLYAVTLCRCAWRGTVVANLKYGAPTP